MSQLKMVKLDHEAMMDCIHCGLCLSQCPTYAEEGVEADSPRGRIYLMRALAEGRVEPKAEVTQHFDSCLGCRACETACPSGVRYGHLIENTREFLKQEQAPTKHRGLLVQGLEAVFPYSNRLDALLIAVRIGRRSGLIALARRAGLMKLLGPLGAMEANLPPLRPFGSHKKFPVQVAARGEQMARVGMVTGCVLPVLQPQVNEATSRVLSKAGCHVDAPRDQRCCGALHAHGGDLEVARDFARHNIALFEDWQAEHGAWDAIIINAAGCGAALKEYPSWLVEDEAWRERAEKFAAKVRDVSEFLAQEPFASRLQVLAGASKPRLETSITRDAPREVVPNTPGASSLPNASGRDNKILPLESDEQTHAEAKGEQPTQPRRVTYHDACHLAHGQGVRAQPRKLVKMASDGLGLELVPLAESEMCCGSAGTYNILQPEMASQLLERKMKNILATGAQIVVSANIGCTLQLRGGIRKHNAPLQVLHPVELLDQATE